MKRAIFLIALLLALTSTHAATIHVPWDQPTIQAGIDAAADGDTVQVYDGTYSGSGNRDITFAGKRVLLKSVNGPELTIIDCEGDPATPHRGFSIGSGDDTTTIVQGFTIANGYAIDRGGAIFCNGGTVTILDCIVRDNTASATGGGIYTYSSMVVRNTVFENNHASTTGGGFTDRFSCSLVENCLFDGNVALSAGGGLLSSNSTTRVNGCTFVNNRADVIGGGLCVNVSATPLINSSIFAFNVNGGVVCEGASVPTITCSDIYGNEGGDWVSCIADQALLNGNFSADPLFCDTLSGDYSLNSCSPCAPSRSLCGTLIGAIGVGCSDVYCGPVWHVAVDGDDVTGDGSAASPYASIQFGIDAAVDGDTVLVAPGAYSEHIDFNGKAIVVVSANGPGDTRILPVVSGMSIAVFSSGESSASVLSGFTLANSTAVPQGGAIYCGNNSSPTIENNSFVGHVGQNEGTVIFIIDSRPIVRRNVFIDNTGGDAVIQCRSDALIENNTIVANNTTGILLQWPTCNPIILNNIIAFNDGHGFYKIDDGSPLLTYNDVIGNALGDYFGVVPGIGSLSADPLFCDISHDDLRIADDSPCLYSGDGGATIGALGVGCYSTDLSVWHVAVDGSDQTGDGSTELPFATIQHAIDQCQNGDTVLIHDGTYTGDGNRDIVLDGLSINVRSENGPTATTINCDGSSLEPHRAFTLSSDQIVDIALSGVTIVNGYGLWDYGGASRGGGIIVRGPLNATIASCVFSSCVAGQEGGAIHSTFDGNVSISGCTFLSNQASQGGGIYLEAVGPLSAIESCSFMGNSAGIGAGAFVNATINATIEVVGCLFVGNRAGFGAVYGSSCSVENCTFAANPLSALYGNGTVENSIIAFNGPADVVSGDFTLSCCDVYGNALGDWTGPLYGQLGLRGNMSSDPLFCDSGNDDYSVGTASECAPTNNSCGVLIGSENVGCVGVSSLGLLNELSQANVVTHVPVIAWSFDGLGDFQQSDIQIRVGTDDDWDESEMWCPAQIETPEQQVSYEGLPLVDGTTYYVRLRIYGGEYWTDWFESAFRMNSLPFVPAVLSPMSGETSESIPKLWLLNSTDAEGDNITYDYEVYLDAEMQYLALSQNGVAEQPDSTGYSWGATMPENQPLWWRCRAFDGYEYSDWSQLTMFFVDGNPEAPSQPEASAPVADSYSILYEMLPTFEWTEALDPDPLDEVHYRLELAVDLGFVFRSVIDDIQGLSYQLTDSLAFDDQYWWRVSAVDQDGLSTTSEVRSFWTWTLGDCNHNHDVSLGDISLLIDHLFINGTPIIPAKTGDVNFTCDITLGDISRLVDYLFITGTEPGVGCE